VRGRGFLIAGLLVIVGLGVVAQILNANVFSDISDAYAYGRFDAPGTKLLRLPSGSLEFILSNPLGTGISIPAGIALSVAPLERSEPAPGIKRDVGDQFGTSPRNGNGIDYQRVWTVDVPRDATYRVTVGGLRRDSFYRLNVGHGPPVGALTLWLVTGIVAVLFAGVWYSLRVTGRRERPQPPAGP
jgi:hypothetical protein